MAGECGNCVMGMCLVVAGSYVGSCVVGAALCLSLRAAFSFVATQDTLALGQKGTHNLGYDKSCLHQGPNFTTSGTLDLRIFLETVLMILSAHCKASLCTVPNKTTGV